MIGRIEVAAPAKVNLVLSVLHDRPDGYHEIETLFQAIDLADDVVVEPTPSGVELEVRGAELGPPESNLAFRAATNLLARVGHEGGVRIVLTKRIPVGAGLGGGSSDAAAVLACLSALLHLRGERVPWEVAAALGSDVPFFLGASPLAWGTGRGEQLDPLPPLEPRHLVVVSPPVHMSTAVAYRRLDEARKGTSRSVDASQVDRSPPPVASWRDVEEIARNDFQDVVAAAHPEVARSLAALQREGAALTLMSGSGSSCFGLFEGQGPAREAAARLRDDLGWSAHAGRTLDELPRPTVR